MSVIVIFIDLADPEVHQIHLLRVAFGSKQDVFWFQVPVNDSFVVNFFDDRQDDLS